MFRGLNRYAWLIVFNEMRVSIARGGSSQCRTRSHEASPIFPKRASSMICAPRSLMSPFYRVSVAPIGIDRRQPSEGRHTVQPYFLHLDRRFGVAEVQERTGRAHRPERTGRDHIDFVGGLFVAVLLDQIDDLLSRLTTASPLEIRALISSWVHFKVSCSVDNMSMFLIAHDC